jgi:LysM repeat protein
VRQSRFARYAAPVAFLAVITIGVLVVRAGFEHGRHHANPPTTTITVKKKHRHAHKKQQVRTYTVQSGDTLGSIAGRFGTTVAVLEHLNPGIDPTALSVGEKIRVK